MRRSVWVVLAVALGLRLVVVAWAHGRIPPTADGHFYHRLATRLAAGEGYTWLWPDGAVTFAAHYPVGYPALIAGPYALFTASPTLAMLLNAIIGALGCVAIERLVALYGRPRAALAAGLLAAGHPALLAYTPALMTEGVVGSLFAIAGYLTARLRERHSWLTLLALGAVLGIATLVRPQSLLLAPIFGVLVGRGLARRALTGGLVLAVALALCLPWTLRNCQRMDRCALVSLNGGWNLLIGTEPEGRGAWVPLEAPPTCRTVWHEAEKDACFAKAALARIRQAPARYLALAPAKIAATFDHGGAPGWYLHAAAPEAFGVRAKWALGAAEILFARLLLIFALLAVWARGRSWRSVTANALAVVGLVAAMTAYGWVGFVAFGLAVVVRARTDVALTAPAIVVLTTAAVHAVFFGGDRYQLVVYPLLCAAAAIGAEVVWRGVRRRGWFGEAPPPVAEPRSWRGAEGARF